MALFRGTDRLAFCFVDMRESVRLSRSWIFFAPLFVWTTGAAALPPVAPELTSAHYWMAGLAVVLALLAVQAISGVVHAALSARILDAPARVIVHLFDSLPEKEPPGSVKGELLTVLASGLTSLAWAALFMSLFIVGVGLAFPVIVLAATLWLAAVMAMIALAKLFPAYPLGSGKVLRALLGRRVGDEVAAHRSRWVGLGFAALLTAAALWFAFQAALHAAIWAAALSATLFWLTFAERRSYHFEDRQGGLQKDEVKR